MYWLAIITVAVWYNFWIVILRSSFDVDTSELQPMWLTLDYMYAYLHQTSRDHLIVFHFADATFSTWSTSSCAFVPFCHVMAIHLNLPRSGPASSSTGCL